MARMKITVRRGHNWRPGQLLLARTYNETKEVQWPCILVGFQKNARAVVKAVLENVTET